MWFEKKVPEKPEWQRTRVPALSKKLSELELPINKKPTGLPCPFCGNKVSETLWNPTQNRSHPEIVLLWSMLCPYCYKMIIIYND